MGLPLVLLEGLRTALGCEALAFNAMDSRRERHRFMQSATADDSGEVAWRGRGRDFDENDVLLLELLRPHLHAAYLKAETERQRLAGSGVGRLTGRQRDVLGLVRDGHTNYSIGRALGISEGTVRTHLQNIYTVLGVSSRTAAVIELEHASPR